jgi:hypothetical protein
VVGKPERQRPLEDLGIDGKTLLEWILGKLGGRYGMNTPGSG